MRTDLSHLCTARRKSEWKWSSKPDFGQQDHPWKHLWCDPQKVYLAKDCEPRRLGYPTCLGYTAAKLAQGGQRSWWYSLSQYLHLLSFAFSCNPSGIVSFALITTPKGSQWARAGSVGDGPISFTSLGEIRWIEDALPVPKGTCESYHLYHWWAHH